MSSVFFHFSLGWLKFCPWGYQTSIIHFVNPFVISLIVEDLFLLIQENSCVMFN